MPIKNDLVNRRFGRLVALRYVGKASGKANWECICDCGNIKNVRREALINGATRSCGCLSKEIQSKFGESQITHGKFDTTEYRIYIGAKQRCENPNNKAYKNYGGRGIRFLFNSFQDFYDCVGDRPNSEYSLDRIDNDGHYEKGNLRWATRVQQMHNQRCDNCGILKDQIAALKQKIKELEGII